MCLAIPAQIVEIEEFDVATIDIGGARKKISLMLVDDAGVGDFVLVHAGFAIDKIDEHEAEETMKLLRQLAELDEIP
jgi:hydrogenase expression/formation protein HypC